MMTWTTVASSAASPLTTAQCTVWPSAASTDSWTHAGKKEELKHFTRLLVQTTSLVPRLSVLRKVGSYKANKPP